MNFGMLEIQLAIGKASGRLDERLVPTQISGGHGEAQDSYLLTLDRRAQYGRGAMPCLSKLLMAAENLFEYRLKHNFQIVLRISFRYRIS